MAQLKDTIVTGDFKVTGNAGIGVATPTEKLHVDGNILASGNIVSGGVVKGVSFRTIYSATDYAFMGYYFSKKTPINTLSTAFSVSSEVGTVPHETKHYLTSAGGTDRMEIYVGKILSGEIALVPTIKIENSPTQSLVTLKGDVLIKKNAEITGNLISKLDTTNIETGIKIFEVAKTINCNILNNEVTLFTVPVGKQCKIGGDSGPYWSMFYDTITTALTVAPELTVTWYDISGSLTTSTIYPSTNKDWYNALILCSPVIGPGAVKLKVTIAATGSTTTSFMISTKIMYK